jgi:coiled-coil domain-containing protein 103
MVSRQDDSINFDKLEKELTAAVEFDSRYWRENDAKFRAVAQKVASYEEFRYVDISRPRVEVSGL